MFQNKLKNELEQTTIQLHSAQALINAIKHSVATIEFSPEGVILDVNDLFLAIAGYQKMK